MPHTNPTNAVSLAMASCDGAVGIYALLLASAKASPRSRHHSETRLRLRIAETVALDPATQEVRAHFFTSSKSGCVMRKNRGSLQLDAVLHSMLRGLANKNDPACIARYQSGRVKVRALEAASLLDEQNAANLLHGVFCLQKFVPALASTRFVVRVSNNIVDTDVLSLPIDSAAAGVLAQGGRGSAGTAVAARERADLGVVAQGLRSTVAGIMDHVLEAHGAKILNGMFEFVYAPSSGRVPGPDNAILYNIESIVYEPGSGSVATVQFAQEGVRVGQNTATTKQPANSFLPPIAGNAASSDTRSEGPRAAGGRSGAGVSPGSVSPSRVLSPRVRAAVLRSAASPRSQDRSFHAEQRRRMKEGRGRAFSQPAALADSDSDDNAGQRASDSSDDEENSSDSFSDEAHGLAPVLEAAAAAAAQEREWAAKQGQALALQHPVLSAKQRRPESAPLSSLRRPPSTLSRSPFEGRLDRKGKRIQQPPSFSKNRTQGNRRRGQDDANNLNALPSVNNRGSSAGFGSAGMASRSMITQFRAQLVKHRSVVDDLSRVVAGVADRHRPLETSMSELTKKVEAVAKTAGGFEDRLNELEDAANASDTFLRREVRQLHEQLDRSETARLSAAEEAAARIEHLEQSVRDLITMVNGRAMPTLATLQSDFGRLQQQHTQHVQEYGEHARRCVADRKILTGGVATEKEEQVARIHRLEQELAAVKESVRDVGETADEALGKVDGIGRRKYGLGWDRGLGQGATTGPNGSKGKKKWQRPTPNAQ